LSYTQLLSDLYVSLYEDQYQQVPQKPPQELGIGLLDKVFDPFSENEDDIIEGAEDDESDDATTSYKMLTLFAFNDKYTSHSCSKY